MVKLLHMFVATVILVGTLSVSTVVAYDGVDEAAVDVVGFNTTQNLGHWASHNWTTYFMEYGQTVMRFTVTARANETFAVRVGSFWESERNGYTVSVLDASGTEVAVGLRYRTGASLQNRLLLARIEPRLGNRTYTIEVRRTNPGFVDGTNLRCSFSLEFMDRTPSRRGTITIPFPASPQVVNNGNTPFNPNGTFSNAATVNLVNDQRIPQGAIVRRVTTRSTMSPSHAHTWHELRHRADAFASWSTWFRPTVTGPTTGLFTNVISEANRIPVRSIWEFRFNSLAPQRTTMSNIRMEIEYLYDPTRAFSPGW